MTECREEAEEAFIAARDARIQEEVRVCVRVLCMRCVQLCVVCVHSVHVCVLYLYLYLYLCASWRTSACVPVFAPATPLQCLRVMWCAPHALACAFGALPVEAGAGSGGDRACAQVKTARAYAETLAGRALLDVRSHDARCGGGAGRQKG